jgi:hemolysin III
VTATLSAAHADKRRPYSLGEEIANSVTHGVGIVLAIAGLVILVAATWKSSDVFAVAASIVYGVSLVIEYSASTLYHALPQPAAKHVFKVLDHAGIYLLIAGTYTPFCLVTLRSAGGWWLFGIVWSLAAIGISTEAFWAYRPRWLSAAVYLGMGWLVAFMIKPVMANIDPAGLWLLVAGGLAYTLGTVFYVLKRIPYFHMIWHLFVLAGSVCHFLAVLLFVVS